MKDRLFAKLDGDDDCVDQLQKLEEKGVSFDQLWEKKIHSAVSNISFYIILLINKYVQYVY
jgi:hypothetical protein